MSADASGPRPKVVAFHLPQYHRIPENDAWWGEGFTEWTNVRKATAQFPGHLQPRRPAGDHYYNMLDPAVRDWQASLAGAHGIDAFCYYHYWFNGRRLLEQPLVQLLATGKPNFSFCLAWANEPWTRTWDGGDRAVLMPQEYGGEPEWRQHFDALLDAWRDPRYLRHEGRPVFLIYRSASIPACATMVEAWRRWALEAGLPGLHLLSMLTIYPRDLRPDVFDGFVEFEPMNTIGNHLPTPFRRREQWRRHFRKLCNKLAGSTQAPPNSYDYAELWRQLAQRALPGRHCPGAFVDWDNTPRRSLDRALVLRNFSTEAFERGLATQYRKARAAGAPLLFVNAWNEWAEGAYLEPDQDRGMGLLEAVRRATST